MSDEQKVRLEATITVDLHTLVDEDVYERWQNGDVKAYEIIGDALNVACTEALADVEPADAVLTCAVLIEDDGYAGTDIAVLKKF